MFKRYVKNPYEKDDTTQNFESEQMTTTVRQPHVSPLTKDRHQLYPFNQKSEHDDFSQSETPPRIFDNRSSRPQVMPHSSQDLGNMQEQGRDVEDMADDEDAWNDKAVDLPSQSFHPENFDEGDPETVLGEGVVFKGALSFKRFLRIDGQFEGELISDGKLIIGLKGVVKSDIKMREVIVEGYVEGNIEAAERIELRGEAQVHGNIITKTLSVDEGVVIDGHVRVMSNVEVKISDDDDDSDAVDDKE